MSVSESVSGDVVAGVASLPAPAVGDAAVWWPASRLRPWDRNPKRHPPAQLEALRRSITENGWGRPVVAHWPSEQLIAGHGAVSAVAQLVEADPGFALPDAPGPGLIPVRFRHEAWGAQLEALALADNRAAELSEWIPGAVASVLASIEAARLADPSLQAFAGWSGAEVAEILGRSKRPDPRDVKDPGPGPVPATPVSVPGQVYQLGPHRLVCGDSTLAETWDALLGDEVLEAGWTDPPFGVSYVGGTGLRVLNDELEAWPLAQLLHAALGHAVERTRPGGAWYVKAPAGDKAWPFVAVLGAMPFADPALLQAALDGASGRGLLEEAVRAGRVLEGLGIHRHTLVWVKDRFVLGRADYHYRHENLHACVVPDESAPDADVEAILYGWREGAAHYFGGGRKLDTVIEVPRPSRSPDHPTPTPVELVERTLGHSAKQGAIVGEPFGGSGTVLIAAARLGLRARLVELSPGYCDVIRRRWTAWALEAQVDPGAGALA